MARNKKDNSSTGSIIENNANDVVVNETEVIDTVKNENNEIDDSNNEIGDIEKPISPVSEPIQELKDEDEIEIVSIVPNVFYKDKQTEDIYEWLETGHSEFLPYSVVKTMWKNNKSYLKDLYLKPMDERVIRKFGLNKIYRDFDFITDPANYTRDNLKNLFSLIPKMSNGLKFVLINKIKEFVIDGSVTDIAVLKGLGTKMDVDFISFT